MVQSIFVYGTLIIVLIWFGKIAARREKINKGSSLSFLQCEILLALLIFSIVSGVRFNVGVDYPNYYENFRFLSIGSGSQYENEPGFLLLTKFFTNNNFHFSVYFGFLALIQLFFVYYAFKEDRYLYPFIIFVLITNGTYFMWMNGIRQSIVISIFIYAIKFIKERKLLKYLVWVFIGFLIHRSAILLIPLYFILVIDRDFFKSIWLQLVLLFIAFILSSTYVWDFFIPQLKQAVLFLGYTGYEDIERHLELRNRDYNKSIRFYFPFIINIIIVLFSRKIKGAFSNTSIKPYYNIYFIGALLSLMLYNNPLMQRPAMFFIYLQFIISAYLLFYLWNGFKRTEIYILVFVFIIVLHLGILYAYISSDYYTHFKFFWEL